MIIKLMCMQSALNGIKHDKQFYYDFLGNLNKPAGLSSDRATLVNKQSWLGRTVKGSPLAKFTFVLPR